MHSLHVDAAQQWARQLEEHLAGARAAFADSKLKAAEAAAAAAEALERDMHQAAMHQKLDAMRERKVSACRGVSTCHAWRAPV